MQRRMYFSACFSFSFQVFLAVPCRDISISQNVYGVYTAIDTHVKLGFDNRELRFQRWDVLFR